jgi:hypothetical protein
MLTEETRNTTMDFSFNLVSDITIMGDLLEINTYGTLYWLCFFSAMADLFCIKIKN